MSNLEGDKVRQLLDTLIGNEPLPEAKLLHGDKPVHVRVGNVDSETREALGIAGDLAVFSLGRELVAVIIDESQSVIAALPVPQYVIQGIPVAANIRDSLKWDAAVIDHLLNIGTLQRA